MNSSEHFTTVATNNNLCKTVLAAVAVLFTVGTCLNNASAYQFFLNSHKDFFWNNGFVVAFNIILWNDTGVFNSGLVKKVSSISFLQKCIADVFFITKNFVYGACPPFCFAGTSQNTICFKPTDNFIHAVTSAPIGLFSSILFATSEINSSLATPFFGSEYFLYPYFY